MQFRVQNLGPLRDAEVDLSKRLLVLTGPNNAGKTFFATAVYGLWQPRIIEPISHNARADSAVANGRFSAREHDLMPLVTDVMRMRVSSLERRFDACFGVGDGTFADARAIVSIDPSDLRLAAKETTRSAWGYTTGSGVGHVRRTVSDGSALAFEFVIVDEALARGLRTRQSHWTDDEWQRLPSIGPDQMGAPVVNEALRALDALVKELTIRRSRIFPAERLAINLFAREIAAARMQLADDLLSTGDTERSAQRLAWPIRDAVRSALRLADNAKRKSEFADLADELEREILGGTIGISPYGAATFTPHQADKSVDVEQSASIVKSLSSIVFYFRHEAYEGDFLLIDEPELNLHPDNQRKVACFLARAAKRGFRILISTHSDYVLRELNNLLMLGRPDERAVELAHDLGYPKDSLLRSEDIGVYLFQDGTAKEVPVSEEGFEVKTIEDEIATLNEISQKIYTTFLD